MTIFPDGKSSSVRDEFCHFVMRRFLFCVASEESKAFFWGSFLRRAVYGDQTEGHAEAFLPFKVIHEAPVAIAFDRDTVTHTIFHTCKCAADKYYAAAVIGNSDAVFRNEQITFKIFPYLANHVLQCIGIEFIIHLRQLCPFRAGQLAGWPVQRAGVVLHTEKIIVFNIGDSRAYWLKNNRLERLSEDQTYVDYLYRTGKITKDETMSHPDRHVLMNALGIYPSCSMDVKTYAYHGERVILCSDGLYNNVSETEISQVVSTDERPDQKVSSLINEANLNGGSYNIGIAYWEAFDD